MVAPSKIFTSPLCYYHCSQSIVHPGRGCTRYFMDNLLEHTLSGLKYFSPLLITPLVLKYKTMNRELLISIVKYYLQAVVWASLATSSVFLSVCCLRNFLGNFRFYTAIFIPTLLGMQFCWFFPKRVLKLFTTATSQSAIEGLLRQHSNKFTHLILHSPIVQTVLFMLNSAIILHYKQKNIYKDFWFIQPYDKLNEKHQEDEETLLYDETSDLEEYNGIYKTKCCHKNSTCQQFILNGMKTYFIYGIPLDLLSMIMRGKMPGGNQSLLSKIIGKLKTFRPNMTGFFISYVGLYRLTSCMLRNYSGHLSLDIQHLISAFIGGFSFLCVKRINFISLSMVISTQILWQQFCDNIKTPKSGKKPNVVHLMLKNAPMSQIIFSLNCAYLVHNSILNYHLINSLARGFLDALTCNKTKNIHFKLVNNDLQTLIDQASSNSIKTFL